MSNNIDNRVVEMQFNNKRFEQNAKQSMSTLDKLKEKLNFKSATNDLKEFQNAGDSFNLDRIASAVEDIGEKFSLMGNLGQQAFKKVADAALNAATNLARSVFVEPVSVGMSKYEQETNAVQTLYATLGPKGKNLEDIYGVLGQLATYSDETSYSYTQMADALSKFVNAGIDINKAETAIEGIANAAALAGVDIHVAQIAFRNFADAIGKGGFKMEDWRSIMNINMNPEWLIDEFLATAAAMGKLEKRTTSTAKATTKAAKDVQKANNNLSSLSGGTKTTATASMDNGGVVAAGDGTYWITTGTGKNKKTVQVTNKNYTDYLKDGIFSSDVIIATMNRIADRETELGNKAFNAAMQAKTFTDVIDAVKDAASTGWATSFKIIFGTLEEAIDFFTPMANAIIEVVNTIDEFRNAVLQNWRDFGGRDSMIAAGKTIWEIFTDLFNLFESISGGMYWNGFLGPITEVINGLPRVLSKEERFGLTLAKITDSIKDTAEKVYYWLGNKKSGLMRDLRYGIVGIGDALGIVSKYFTTKFRVIFDIIKQLRPTFEEVIHFFGDIGIYIDQFAYYLNKNQVFEKLGEKISAIFVPITSRLPEAIKKVRIFVKRIVDFLKTNNRFIAFRESIGRLFWTVLDAIPKIVNGTFELWEQLKQTILKSDEWKKLTDIYNRYVKPFFRSTIEGGTVLADSLSNFFSMDVDKSQGLWEQLKQRFSAFDRLGPWFQEKWAAAKEKLPWLQNVEDWFNSSPIVKAIGDWIHKIGEAIDAFFSTDTSNETSLVGKVKARLLAAYEVLSPFISGQFRKLKNKFVAQWELLKLKLPWLQKVEDFFKTSPIIDSMRDWVTKIGDAFGQFLNADTSGEETLGGKIKARFTALYEAISGFISKKLERFQKWVSLKWVLLQSKLPWLENVSEWFNSLPFVNAIKKWFEDISAAVDEKLNGSEGNIGIIGTIKGWFETLVETIKELFTPNENGELSFVARIREWLSGIFGSDGNTFIDAIRARIESWQNLGRKLQGLFEEGALFDQIKEFFGNIIHWDGWEDIWELVKNFIKNLTLEDLSKIASIMFIVWKIIRTWKLIKAIGGVSESISDFFDECTKTVKAYRKSKFQNIGATILSIAASFWLIADALRKIAEMNWDQLGKGLTAFFAVLIGEGGFIILVNKFGSTSNGLGIETNAAVKLSTLLGIALNMEILSNILIKLGKAGWETIVPGMAAMFSVFFGEGLFIALVNKLGSTGAATSTTGSVSSTAMSQSPLTLGTLLGIAANMWLLSNVLIKLGKAGWETIGPGIAAMFSVFFGEGAFIVCVNRFGSVPNTKTAGANIITLLGITASMWLLGELVIKLGSQPWDNVKHGLITLGGILAADGVMMVLIKTLSQNGGLDLGAATKFCAVLIEIAAALGVAVALFLEITGSAIADFGDKIALVGAQFAQYYDQVKDVDSTKALNSANTLFTLSTILVLIGGENIIAANISVFCEYLPKAGAALKLFSENVTAVKYGSVNAAKDFLIKMKDTLVEIAEKTYTNVDSFRTNLSRLGSTVKVFSTNVTNADPEKMKTISGTLKQMATDLSGFPEVKDVGTSIGHIGGAIKLYAESLNGVKLDKAPDTTAIKTVFDTLKDALPDDENLTNMAAYASDDKGSELTNFAIGLTNIATAVSDFSKSADEMNFKNVDKAVDALAAIAKIDTQLGSTTVAQIGPFAASITTEAIGDLSTFATDIVGLGSAVSDFAGNTNGLNFDNIDKAIDALVVIAKIDTQLGSTTVAKFGPFGVELNQQATGLATFPNDIVLLGTALKDFGTNIGAVDISQMTAGVDVLKKIVDLNNALPQTGGLAEMLTGSKSLTRFAANLRLLGSGAKAFSASVSGESFDANAVSGAGDALIKIAEINKKLPKTGGLAAIFTGDASLDKFGSSLGTLGEGVVAFSKAIGNESFGQNVIDGLNLFSRIASIQKSLATTKAYEYNLDQIASEFETAAGSIVRANNVMTDVTWNDTTGLVALMELAAQKNITVTNKTGDWSAITSIATEFYGAAENMVAVNNLLATVTEWADTTGFENLLSFAVEEQNLLANKTFSKSIKDVGTDLKNFFNEVWSFTQDWLGGNNGKLDQVANSLTSIFGALHSVFEDTEKNNDFTLDGEKVIAFIATGFDNQRSLVLIATKINNVCKEVSNTVLGYKQSFRNIGTWIPAGLATGILENKSSVINAAIIVMNEAIDAAKATADIQSPSRAFAEIGMYSDLGLAQGLLNSVSAVRSAAGEVSQSALDAMLSDMMAVQDLPLDQIEITPTIRPVLDTSDISSRAGMIDDLLGGARQIGFNTRQLEARAQILEDAGTNDMTAITNRLNDLNNNVTELRETMANLRVVLNNGVLVGQLASDIDKNLGMRASRRERGS